MFSSTVALVLAFAAASAVTFLCLLLSCFVLVALRLDMTVPVTEVALCRLGRSSCSKCRRGWLAIQLFLLEQMLKLAKAEVCVHQERGSEGTIHRVQCPISPVVIVCQ